MAITGTDVENRVRDQISDTVATERHLDPELLRYLNDAIREVVKVHPESQYLTAVVVTDPTALTAIGDTILLTDKWLQALVDYVCWQVFGEDSEDDHNAAMAAAHKTDFLGAL